MESCIRCCWGSPPWSSIFPIVHPGVFVVRRYTKAVVIYTALHYLRSLRKLIIETSFPPWVPPYAISSVKGPPGGLIHRKSRCVQRGHPLPDWLQQRVFAGVLFISLNGARSRSPDTSCPWIIGTCAPNNVRTERTERIKGRLVIWVHGIWNMRIQEAHAGHVRAPAAVTADQFVHFLPSFV